MANVDLETKTKLDKLLVEYKVQPVGWGYIDCITTNDNVSGFVSALTQVGIHVTGITWWCHCAIEGKEESGCPHGGGGPRSDFFDGWFSEMYQIPFVETQNNNEIIPYIFSEWPNTREYLPCLIPAFWLDVPDDWRNEVNLRRPVQSI